MSVKKGNLSRRNLLKTACAAGLGSMLVPLSSVTQTAHGSASSIMSEQKIVPTRRFGKTGVDVPMLALGGVLGMSDQLVFRQTLKMGVTYWDTADSYGWGKNEKAIGKFFAKFPEDRKKVFLVTKAATSDPRKLTEKLTTSLARMNASYVDMYLIHYVSDVKDEMTDEVKAWAEKAKGEGKIRFFGFSAHKNMENSMLDAAKLGWIDGIMMSYNYRLMGKDKMKRAVDACVKAGIGLTAMKTQAAFSANFYAQIGSETDEALNMTERFLEKGYTAEQAKLKVVWENPNIASICSAMPNMTILQANVAAAVNKNSLSRGDKRRLQQYAQHTASGYCAGCADTCEPAVDLAVPISDILRYSMYHQSYGERDRAQALFNELPADVKVNILGADYSKAEKCCPHKIQIGKVLRKTYQDLA
ncbi:MAG: aldo/keto reductase [Desulfobacterales bacterium]|nr:MAG: aldo/keto reductase [Desulfobacterales bacterium]